MRWWEIVGMEEPSGDTPSVSHSLDSSLREGAGIWCVPFNVPLGNRGGAGDFHRPYEGSECFTFHHSSGYSLNRKGAGDFHRPYERRFPFIGVLGKREGLYRSMEIVSKWVQKSVRVHCSMGVLNIQLEIYFFQWKV